MGDSELEKYTVSGHSMYPLLRDGQEVEIQPQTDYQIGDIVVARHPFLKDTVVIKQISEVTDSGYYLKSIGEGTSNFGTVKLKDIIGKVLPD